MNKTKIMIPCPGCCDGSGYGKNLGPGRDGFEVCQMCWGEGEVNVHEALRLLYEMINELRGGGDAEKGS